MTVSFVVLAHEHPKDLKDLLVSLLSSGSDVFLHYDARAPHDLEGATKEWGITELPGKLYLADRVEVVWGEWSIIQATLNCLRLARSQGLQADYYALLSGSCMPVKPIALLQKYLSDSNVDYIEAVNAETNRWVTDGIQHERWEYFHYFNWRFQEFRFRLSNKIQKLLKIKRTLPLKHVPHMGSQWWCLRNATVEKILSVLDASPEVEQFYQRTWIPDELFFQTMVGNLVAEKEINDQLLTRYKFNSWGIPRVYYDGDLPELMGERLFFARKISHRAEKLKSELSAIGAMTESEYNDYLETHGPEYRECYLDQVYYDRQCQRNAWRALVVNASDPFQYVKAIPNPLVIICSLDSRIKSRLLETLESLDNTVIHGDLLDDDEIGFGKGVTSVAGYRRTDVKLAKHKWHIFLGDICSQYDETQRIVFSMGKEALDYLNILRWRHDLTVILVDDTAPVDGNGLSLPGLFELGQLHREEQSFRTNMVRLMDTHHCEFHVIDAENQSRIKELVLERQR